MTKRLVLFGVTVQCVECLYSKVAKELADKLEREEKLKKRALELRDQNIVRQMLEKERFKVANGPIPLPPRVKDQPPVRPPLPIYTANIPKRQGMPMPLPLEGGVTTVTRSLERHGLCCPHHLVRVFFFSLTFELSS